MQNLKLNHVSKRGPSCCPVAKGMRQKFYLQCSRFIVSCSNLALIKNFMNISLTCPIWIRMTIFSKYDNSQLIVLVTASIILYMSDRRETHNIIMNFNIWLFWKDSIHLWMTLVNLFRQVMFFLIRILLHVIVIISSIIHIKWRMYRRRRVKCVRGHIALNGGFIIVPL